MASARHVLVCGFCANQVWKSRFCTSLSAQMQHKMLLSNNSGGEPTLCQGINYLKEGSDPPLLPDSEYPEWLWDVLKPKEPVDTDSPDIDSKAYWRRVNKIKRRKENAARKGKKL